MWFQFHATFTLFQSSATFPILPTLSDCVSLLRLGSLARTLSTLIVIFLMRFHRTVEMHRTKQSLRTFLPSNHLVYLFSLEQVFSCCVNSYCSISAEYGWRELWAHCLDAQTYPGLHWSHMCIWSQCLYILKRIKKWCALRFLTSLLSSLLSLKWDYILLQDRQL